MGPLGSINDDDDDAGPHQNKNIAIVTVLLSPLMMPPLDSERLVTGVLDYN